jgi:hypothetical protein
VHWTEGLVRGFWSVTRYDDILAVFRAFKSECTTRCISPSEGWCSTEGYSLGEAINGLRPSGTGAIRLMWMLPRGHHRLGHGSHQDPPPSVGVSSTRRGPDSLPLGAILPNKPNLYVRASSDFAKRTHFIRAPLSARLASNDQKDQSADVLSLQKRTMWKAPI